MQRRLLLALALAALAAVLTWIYLNEREAELKAGVTPVKVLVAKRPIARGSALVADKVAIQELPGAYVMPGVISATTTEGVTRQWEEIKGQFAVVPIAKGEQILPNKLSRILPGFSVVAPEGMRQVAFTLDPAAAVGGHLRPGNRVDVVGTFEHQFRGAKRITSVALVQNVLVTAVGAQTLADREGRNASLSAAAGDVTVCLAVTPTDALRLSLGEREGALKLVLRSLGDENMLDLADQNLGTLLGPLLRVPSEEVRSGPRRIEIIRGLPVGGN